MNRTDRLLAIVLELQGKSWQRAEDLAATFETSKRTIYRDLQALGQAGVPVVSVPGRGYSLVAGYFLPPLSFTVDEATMLLLGSDVMAESFDAQYRAAAESAGRKIMGIVPDPMRADIAAVRERIQFVTERAQRRTESSALRLQVVRRAIMDCHRLRFRYFTRRRFPVIEANHTIPTASEREANPYALARVHGVWYLTGYCHLRHDVRTFRLDRMEDIETRDETFARPRQLPIRPGERERDETASVIARALFAPTVARWVRETPSFYTIAEEETPDGLLVTLAVRHESELVQWLLGWGGAMRVLEPESLRRLIAREAEQLAQLHR